MSDIDITIEYDFDPEEATANVKTIYGSDGQYEYGLMTDVERVATAKVTVSFGAKSVTFILDQDFVEQHGAMYSDGLQVVKLVKVEA